MNHSFHDYVCTHCGAKVQHNQRFFPVDQLMEIFRLGNAPAEVCSTGMPSAHDLLFGAVPTFSVGALFGKEVLGSPVSTVRADQLNNPDDYRQYMTEVSLKASNVMAMISAQMEVSVKTLLHVILESDRLVAGQYLDAETNGAFERIQSCLVKGIPDAALENAASRQERIASFLSALGCIIAYDPSCSYDPENFCFVDTTEAPKQVRVCWVTTPSSSGNAERPAALLIYDESNNKTPVIRCERSCCPFCYKPVPKCFGVYPQTVVGVLGGQRTGKTTMMAALADLVQTDAIMNQVPFTIQCGEEDSAEWSDFMMPPLGPLHLYRNGYRAAKTHTGTGTAATLTFLISPRSKYVEPQILVLADIAGEAFDGEKTGTAIAAATRDKPLLRNCDALLMAFSCDPEDTAINASTFANWMRGFSGDMQKDIPAALLLTKVDKLFQDAPASDLTRSGLRASLQYLRKTQPVINGRYNVETMSSLSHIAFSCANILAPGMMAQLQTMLGSTSSNDLRLGCFPICSGTADYIDYTDTTKPSSAEGSTDSSTDSSAKADGPDQDLHSRAARFARYEKARQERSGVFSVLGWLLALQRVLPIGRGPSSILNYDKAATDLLNSHFKSDLRFPSSDI